MIQEPSKTQQAINQLNGSLEEAASLDKQAMDLALETLAKSILSSQEYLSLQSLQSRISKLDHPPFFSSLIQKKLQAPISTSDATQKVFQLFPPQQQTTALLIPLQQQTTALLIAIEELLKKPGTHVQSIQDILKLFPPNERTSNLFQSLCLLDLSSDMVRIAISLIKENQRDEPLLKDLKVLFENIQDFELRDIVNALGHIEEDLRAKCIQDTAFFFSKTSYKKNQDKILTSISQIRKGPNKDVIEKVLSLLEGYMQVQEKAKLIRTFGVHNIQAIFQIIDKTPQSQREEIVKHTLALLECAPRYSFLQTILQEILNLPQDQRQEIIDQTIYFLEKSGNCDALDYLLPTIANIPSNQRKDIIDQAIPILQGTKEGRMHILQIISNTPPHVRQELITRATPFLKQTDNGFYQESILEFFLLFRDL